jgi:hypothetical protein
MGEPASEPKAEVRWRGWSLWPASLLHVFGVQKKLLFDDKLNEPIGQSEEPREVVPQLQKSVLQFQLT